MKRLGRGYIRGSDNPFRPPPKKSQNGVEKVKVTMKKE